MQKAKDVAKRVVSVLKTGEDPGPEYDELPVPLVTAIALGVAILIVYVLMQVLHVMMND